MNDENLIPHEYKKGDTKDKAANGKKGGIASGIAKRKRKTMGELIAMFMTQEVKEPEVKAKLMNIGIPEEECNNQAKLMMTMFANAAKGNATFMKMILDYGKSNETIELEKKKMEKDIKESTLRQKQMKEQIKEQQLKNKKLEEELNAKNDVEDLTPLAKLLQDDEDEKEIDREVEADGN